MDETTAPAVQETPASAEQPGAAVDAALTPLDSLGERPLAEHPDVYQAIHTTLRDELADINEA